MNNSSKKFVGGCINFSGKGSSAFLRYIIDHPQEREITEQTFLSNVDINSFPKNHPLHPKNRGVGFYGISYHKSKLPSGKPVYYAVWSGIEHLFVDKPFSAKKVQKQALDSYAGKKDIYGKENHPLYTGRRGSKGVMKQIDSIAGDLYHEIDRNKRTVEPDWDTVVRMDEGTPDVPMEVIIPKRWYKSYLEMPHSILKSKMILDYIIDKFGWMVPSFNFTYKYDRVIKALDRLTEYALGKRTTSYTSKKRKEDTEKVIDYIKSQHIHAPGTAKEKKAYLEVVVDGLIHRNMEYIRLQMLSMRHYGGVILFSGGLDSVALAMARNIKEGAVPLLPIYISHRSNVGNVTKKEIRTAQKLAKKILGEELMVIKADAKSGNLPEWYGKRVFVTERMPVAKTQKNKRNRKFLEVLKDYGLADRQIWVGVLGIPGAGDRSRAAGRAKDVTKEGLQQHLKSIGGKGKIKVVRDIPGVKTKADLLKKIEKHYKKRFRPDIFESQSCLMYFNKPCGDCWSCVERAESIMQAYGQDQTPYRKNSKADKIKSRNEK